MLPFPHSVHWIYTRPEESSCFRTHLPQQEKLKAAAQSTVRGQEQNINTAQLKHFLKSILIPETVAVDVQYHNSTRSFILFVTVTHVHGLVYFLS